MSRTGITQRSFSNNSLSTLARELGVEDYVSSCTYFTKTRNWSPGMSRVYYFRIIVPWTDPVFFDPWEARFERLLRPQQSTVRLFVPETLKFGGNRWSWRLCTKFSDTLKYARWLTTWPSDWFCNFNRRFQGISTCSRCHNRLRAGTHGSTHQVQDQR